MIRLVCGNFCSALLHPLAGRYAFLDNRSSSVVSKKQDLTKLKDLIAQNSSNDTHLVFNNTFAMACYLSIMGETIASEKLLNSLFDWLGREHRTTYFQDIFSSFHANAHIYSKEIKANVELTNLLNRTVSEQA